MDGTAATRFADRRIRAESGFYEPETTYEVKAEYEVEADLKVRLYDIRLPVDQN